MNNTITPKKKNSLLYHLVSLMTDCIHRKIPDWRVETD